MATPSEFSSLQSQITKLEASIKDLSTGLSKGEENRKRLLAAALGLELPAEAPRATTSTPEASTTDVSSLESRLAEIGAAVKNSSLELSKDDASREKMLATARELVADLESPPETIWRMIMEPHQGAAVRTAIAMGIIEPIANSEKPITAAELEAVTGAEKLLIVRILRVLVAMRFAAETGFETYTWTPLTKALTHPGLSGGFQFMFDEASMSLSVMPTFLENLKFKNPVGEENMFHVSHNTKLDVFPYLMEHPKQMSNFNKFMGGQRLNRKNWFDFFPVNEILLDGFKGGNDDTLIIDIAGGIGHDLADFKKHFPEVQGKLVLQDLPPVINDIKELDPAIVRMPHDFFTPQPVKGAKAYYFRSIMHDWSDSKCREILSNTVSAMTPGYSKLLLSEWILPDTGSILYPALLDLNMMTLFNGMERTEGQWRELLASVGLEVVKFYSIGKHTEGLIEAALKQ